MGAHRVRVQQGRAGDEPGDVARIVVPQLGESVDRALERHAVAQHATAAAEDRSHLAEVDRSARGRRHHGGRAQHQVVTVVERPDPVVVAAARQLGGGMVGGGGRLDEPDRVGDVIGEFLWSFGAGHALI